MRLIDADALNKEFRDFVRAANNSDPKQTPNWNDAVSLVGSAPTVDAVQVVRCKDCKHYEPLSDEGGIGICDMNPTGKLAFAHWFCADGERKDNESEN